jgi:short-subunit dehydrogenase
MEFTQKYGPWALVTGASVGLGAQYCRQLAAKKINLVLVARSTEQLEALASELQEQKGVQCRVLAIDLTTENAIEQISAGTKDLEIGLLINNAGFGWKGPFLEGDAARMRKMIRLNCEVPTMLSFAFLPAMVARGHGGMIMLASTAAFQPTPFFSVYGATKGFDLLLGEALHEEYRGTGLDVLTVCPGSTDTNFHAVANTESTFPSMADPADVVKKSLERLGKRMTFIDGFKNSMMVAGNRIAPRSMVAKVSARVIKKVIKPS